MSVGQSNPLSKLSAMFPHFIVPFGTHDNMREYIDKVVRDLPKPAPYEISDALFNMKNIVDSQELQIQRNMIEEDTIGHSDHREHHNTQHEQLEHKTPFMMKDEEVKGQDMWWSEQEESENKDYLHFLN